MIQRNKQLIIAVDFDGTCVTHNYPDIGKPIPNALKVLKRLQQQGHKLILWTCRDSQELRDAIAYCKQGGLTFDAVNANIPGIGINPKPKIYADLYIDDRGYGTVIDWDAIELDLIS